MIRYFYSRKTGGDVLYIVIEPSIIPDEIKNVDGVVALYKEGRLIGANLLDISKTIKIKSTGMIPSPSNVFVDAVNSLLAKAGVSPLPYCEDSYYEVGEVTKIEEHPLDEKLSIVTLKGKDKEYQTVTRYHNFVVGDLLVYAKSGCIKFDGTSFFSHKSRNIDIDVELCSGKDLRLNEEEKEAFLAKESKQGEDFFLGGN